ncbi:hypothetical protein [Streptomyces sp. NPDC050804]|uniref:hypothetical protein n=1 Tax=Streptomyces sp. NPDC050804 TaxID=3154745 RepID=UPI003428EA39
MNLPKSLFRRRPEAEPVIDVSTPEAQREYRDALEEKERAHRAMRLVVDFSRPPEPPPIRARWREQPYPDPSMMTFHVVRKPSSPGSEPSRVVPDVVV